MLPDELLRIGPLAALQAEQVLFQDLGQLGRQFCAVEVSRSGAGSVSTFIPNPLQ